MAIVKLGIPASSLSFLPSVIAIILVASVMLALELCDRSKLTVVRLGPSSLRIAADNL